MPRCCRSIYISQPPRAQAQHLFDEGKCLLQSGRHSDAAATFSRAMSQGHSLALAHLSWLLLFGGAGVPHDRARAFELLRSRECARCCHCQGCISCCYAEGWGTEKNPTLALHLAQQSAAAGSVFGLYMMGWLHDNGIAVAAVNQPLALAFYERAAAAGLAAAQNNAGFMCAASRGVVALCSTAMRHYTLTLDCRHHHAQGVPRDYSKAVHFYKLAAAQRDCDALYNLACLLEAGHGAPRDIDHAVRLYHAAAELGQRSALYDLGYIYQHGLNVCPNFVEAARLYQRAADLGHPLALNNLAFM